MKHNPNGNKQYRQGDVLVEKVDSIATGEAQKDTVLAHGEVTGHFHGIASAKAKVFASPESSANLEVKALVAEEDTKIIHQEHDHIGIEAGNYRVIRQREYTPEAIRNVAD